MAYNLAGILGDARADPVGGLVGSDRWRLGAGRSPSPEKNDFFFI